MTDFADWFYVAPAYNALTTFLDLMEESNASRQEEKIKEISFSKVVKEEIDHFRGEIKLIKWLDPVALTQLEERITACYESLTHFEAQATTFGPRSLMVFHQLQQDLKAWIYLQRGDFGQTSTANLMSHFRQTLLAWAGECKQYENSIRDLGATFKCLHVQLLICKSHYDEAIEEQQGVVNAAPPSPMPPSPPTVSRSWLSRSIERVVHICSIVLGVLEMTAGAALCASAICAPLGVGLLAKGFVVSVLGVRGLKELPRKVADEKRRQQEFLHRMEHFRAQLRQVQDRFRSNQAVATHRIKDLQQESKAISTFQGDTVIPLLNNLQILLGQLQAKTSFFQDSHLQFVVSVDTPPRNELQLKLFLQKMVGYTGIGLEPDTSGTSTRLMQRLFKLVNFSPPSLVLSTTEPVEDHEFEHDVEVNLAALPVTKSRTCLSPCSPPSGSLNSLPSTSPSMERLFISSSPPPLFSSELTSF